MEPEGPSAKPNIAVGIDFGTTNSLIAVVMDDKCIVIPDENGDALLPSIVAYEENGTAYVGKEAEAKPCYIRSIKRVLGRKEKDFSDKDSLYRTANKIVYDAAGEVSIQTGSLKKAAVEVAAEIIKSLKHRAENFIGSAVNDAVITVPAYFDDGARNAVKVAAQLAGLNVMRLINEPTSAAYAYGLEEGPEGTFMVYDLGGGTFDISILQMQRGVFQVIATAGDNQLGGDDFDMALVEFLAAQREVDTHNLSPDDLRNLLSLARNIKHHLSDHEIWSDGEDEITRQQLESIITTLVNRTLKIIDRALNDAGRPEIDKLILVGGATRTPYIKQQLAARFNVMDELNPEQIVVQGAAMKAHSMSGGSGGGLLIDVTPLSLGIELADGVNEIIIPRNTAIPASYKHNFATGKDNQTGFVIHVLQGEGQMVSQCRSLAKFHLDKLPPLPAGMVKLELTFQIDADGILTVTAKELHTNTSQQVLVKPSYGLAQDDLLKLRQA